MGTNTALSTHLSFEQCSGLRECAFNFNAW